MQQGTFNEYGILRLAGMPRVEVFIVPSTEKPGGAGHRDERDRAALTLSSSPTSGGART